MGPNLFLIYINDMTNPANNVSFTVHGDGTNLGNKITSVIG